MKRMRARFRLISLLLVLAFCVTAGLCLYAVLGQEKISLPALPFLTTPGPEENPAPEASPSPDASQDTTGILTATSPAPSESTEPSEPVTGAPEAYDLYGL